MQNIHAESTQNIHAESTQNIHAESTRKIFTRNATRLLVVAHQKCFPTRCIKLSLQMIATDAFILARVEYDEFANPKHVKTDICDCVSLGYLDVSFGAAAKIFTQNPLREMLFMTSMVSKRSSRSLYSVQLECRPGGVPMTFGLIVVTSVTFA